MMTDTTEFASMGKPFECKSHTVPASMVHSASATHYSTTYKIIIKQYTVFGPVTNKVAYK